MKNIKFYTLHLDNILPNIGNIYYIHHIGKWDQCGDIAFSAHQNTEIEQKETLYKKWTELTIPLIFGLGTIVRLQVCSYLPGIMNFSRFHSSYHDNKF